MEFSDFKNLNYTLAKSITLKLEILAYQINSQIRKKYTSFTISSDKREWKYYLNLAGIYHSLDADIIFTDPNTNTNVKLTTDYLDANYDIRNELMLMGDMYKKLLADNKGMSLLIRGIILPVDIDVAINSKDGTILSYNKSLVESQEINLMDDIQQYIFNLFSRWYNEFYTYTDEMFIPAIFAIIYSKIPKKLENIRLANVHTYRVHSFHVSSYFASNRELHKAVANLPLNIRMWLYKNARYLQTHSGSNETLALVIEKVLTASGIGIGEIKFYTEDLKLKYENLNDPLKPLADKGDLKFISLPLNSKFNLNKGKITDLSELINKEIQSENIPVEIYGNSHNFIKPVIEEQIANNKFNSGKTKILEFDTIGTYNASTVPEFTLVLDSWADLVLSKRLTASKEFLDTNTNISYNLTHKQAFLVLIKMFANLANTTDLTFDKYVCSLSLNRNYSVNSLIENLIDSNEMKPFAEKMVLAKPAIINNYNTDISDYIYDLNSLIVNIIFYSNSSGNALLASGFHAFQHRMVKEQTFDLKVDGVSKTIDELLSLENIDFTFDENYDYANSIKDLLQLFTGVKLNGEQAIDEITNNYKVILEKFTSYTVHAIYDKAVNNNLVINFDPESLIDFVKPLVQVDDDVFNELEEFYGIMNISKHNMDNDPVAYTELPFIFREGFLPTGFAIVDRIEEGDVKIEDYKNSRPLLLMYKEKRDLNLYQSEIKHTILEENPFVITDSAEILSHTEPVGAKVTVDSIGINEIMFEDYEDVKITMEEPNDFTKRGAQEIYVTIK